MTDTEYKLPHPPIVEAVLDIECDLPPGQDIVSFENDARACFSERYPIFRTQVVQLHQIAAKPGESPEISVHQNVQALQFLQDDEKQLIQMRKEGFSFNRLSPYTSLDDYLPEIERTWHLYLGLAKPLQIRAIRMRFINRILLPLEDGQVDLDKYLIIAPRLPEEDKLKFVSFFNQHAALDVETGSQVNIVLTTQPPEGGSLPVIFDNTVLFAEHRESDDWDWILSKIQVLRHLKNRIFRKALTETCLNLFQQP